MKKIIIALSLAFLIFSCNDDDMENETNNPNPLIGTWEDTWTDEDGDNYSEKFIFTENEFSRIYNGFMIISDSKYFGKESRRSTEKGSYYCADSVIYFTAESLETIISNPDKYEASLVEKILTPSIEYPIEATAKYSIADNKLTITFSWNNETYTYKRIN